MSAVILARTKSICRIVAVTIVCLASGCSLVPETRTRDVMHNPFPQLKRVAVLPFFNQSEQPNLDGDAVARAYYAALQAIPGFEVLPVGVTAMQWQAYSSQFGEPRTGAEFQRLAQMMDVEAIVVGSVTDYDAYYPPRMAMTVHWYAASEGFHPIPAGYGLPWGTKGEEKIPARIVREAEFELARSQLKTQIPQEATAPIDRPVRVRSEARDTSMEPDSVTALELPPSDDPWGVAALAQPKQQTNPLRQIQFDQAVAEHQILTPTNEPFAGSTQQIPSEMDAMAIEFESVPIEESFEPYQVANDWIEPAPLPPDWPEPTDLIPDAPSPVPPVMIRQHEPVLTHTRLYRGDDPYFTQRLTDYVETGDDARGMSWQGYIKRSEDFIRFCCHLHITEMLEARGGRDPSDLILRWPVSRY
ncbi:hypothetical protein [Neorhodopirellula pilleata]